jgi:hypothetical protein
LAKFKNYALAGALLLIVLPAPAKAQSSSAAGRTQAQPQAQARTQAQPQATDSSAFALLDSLFHRPEFLYVIDGPDIPADMQPILIRFNNAITANQAWFQQYRNNYPNQTLPYDEHFGITAEEYRRVLRLQAAPPPLVPVDSQTVAVIKDGDFIHFQSSTGEGEEHLLNYLYIDPVHRVLEYGGDTIPFAGPASAGRKSPYGQWQGYAWRLERVQSLAPPIDPLQPTDPQKAPDPSLISVRIVEVNIGIPGDSSGKAFIRIQYQNLQAGITTANMELLGYIR